MRATAVTFDESGRYNLGVTEERRPRKQMKTAVVPNEDVVVLTEEEEERQRSSAIPTTIARPREQLSDIVQPHGTSEEYPENQEQSRPTIAEASRLSSSSTHT